MERSDRDADETWTTPQPEYIPPPSFHPIFLALGTVLFVWTPAFFYVKWWIIVPVSAIILIGALVGWIREIRGDWRAEDGQG